MSWQLSTIWSPLAIEEETGPIGMFLAIGLYGVYIVVFSLSVWTMYRDEKRSSGVRWVVVATFVVVALYMIATLVYYPINFDAFITHMPLMRFGVVALAWYKMSPCVCYSLSDGVLAWRCYVIFGKRQWLKWTLTVVVLGVTACGLFSSIIELVLNWEDINGLPDGTAYNLLISVEHPTTLIWAVCSLALNTALSTSIVVEIVVVNRQTSRHFASSRSIPLARAFIESCLTSWIALAVYTGLYSHSRFLPDSSLVVQGKSVLVAILPLIFSISQALVFARLGVSRFAASTSFKDTVVALTSDDHDAIAPRSLAVA